MSELTDALIQLLGPEVGVVLVVLLAADAVQTRYIVSRIDRLDDRVERVEDVHISTDGGDNE